MTGTIGRRSHSASQTFSRSALWLHPRWQAFLNLESLGNFYGLHDFRLLTIGTQWTGGWKLR